MGILTNGIAIILGAALGSCIKKIKSFTTSAILGIGIMILSAIGIIENIFEISEHELKSANLVIVIFALIVGTVIGDSLKIHEKIEKLEGRFVSGSAHAFITGTLFFGVGGLQITGPLLLATESDSTQLFLKSMIDFPFAITLGAACGISLVISALPVMLLQVLIFAISLAASPYMTADFISQISALGYIILFFVGFDMISKHKYIHTVNMLPSIALAILFTIIKELIL